MSDVDRERETLADVLDWTVFGTEDGDLLPDDSTLPVGEVRRLVHVEGVPAVLEALPGLGWVRRKDMLAEQAAATELTRLSEELDLP